MNNTARKISTEKPSIDSQEFLEDVISGLKSEPKTLPCRYFYDDKGSQLFEEICTTSEYYVTRTEIALLHDKAEEISSLLGKKTTIIEPGAGAMIKVLPLLKALNQPHSYIPTDISGDFLLSAAEKLEKEFTSITIRPEIFNFYETDNLTQLISPQFSGRYLIFFPGSTIGNFDPKDAEKFLSSVAKHLRPQDAMLVGVDLVKDSSILEAAYNDKQGVTSAFNKNLLTRINKELLGSIDLNTFHHQSHFNAEKNRIEMHLISAIDQTISIDDKKIEFSKDETIHTENSYKYSVNNFKQLAEDAGFESKQCWTDQDNFFSLHYLEIPA